MEKHIFEAGTYWIGDPCYAVKDENWGKLLEDTGYFGFEEIGDTGLKSDGSFYYNGEKCFCAGTKYGDGSYLDNYGDKYGVDAGLLGIIPLVACDGNSMGGGHIVIFDKDFLVYAKDGLFKFGHVVIRTDNFLLDFEEDDYDEDESE